MSITRAVRGERLERLGEQRRNSFSRLAVADGLAAFAVAALVCGIGGLFVDPADGVVLISTAIVTGGIGLAGRRTFERRRRPPPGQVVVGLASTWTAMVLAGTAVYLLTGTTSLPQDALFEASAGFSTTALTTLDSHDLSSTMHVWRASTQWLGGLLGILAAVVALPGAMRQSVHVPEGQGRRPNRLAPTPITGRRRIMALYGSLTVACAVAYLATGMEARDSVAHALTTLSTGGMSTQPDSFASYGTDTRIVATVFMILAGISYFVLWWVVRGRRHRFVQSNELKLYLAMVVLATVGIVAAVDGISVIDAVFRASSAASTTGFAVNDWTLFPPAALSILLVVVATGAMGASAGGGLRVVRARALVQYARRELRRQLDPNSVTVVIQDGRAIDDRVLDRLTGYQIAHFGLCAIGAFFLTTAGVELVTALWVAISVVSTAGPAPGIGAFGDVRELGDAAHLLLIPGMLAGRLTILPLLMAVATALRMRDLGILRLKRLLRFRR